MHAIYPPCIYQGADRPGSVDDEDNNGVVDENDSRLVDEDNIMSTCNE